MQKQSDSANDCCENRSVGPVIAQKGFEGTKNSLLGHNVGPGFLLVSQSLDPAPQI